MAIKLAATPKPIQGQPEGKIPEDLVKLLESEVPKVLKDLENQELTLVGENKGEAETYAGYARAWGMRQEKKLVIRRQPPRREQPNNVVRLAVSYHDPEKPGPGRPKGSHNSPAATEPATEGSKESK
jgi:hypothetical protein